MSYQISQRVVLQWSLLLTLSHCGSLDSQKKKNPDKPQTPVTEPQVPTPPKPIPAPAPAPAPLPAPKIPLESTLESMQTNLVQNNCIDCHKRATARNRLVDLTDLSKIITNANPITQPGEMRKIIRAGCPDVSIFYLAIKNDQMPMGNFDKIGEDDKKTIFNWIQNLVPEAERNCNDEPIDN